MKLKLIALAVALVAAASAQAQSAKLKVGLMLPATGTFAALGTAIENGFRLYVTEQGGKLADICKIVIYITDPRYREDVYRVVGKHLKGVYPVSTGLVVQGLARPEWVMEIDVYAVIPESRMKNVQEPPAALQWKDTADKADRTRKTAKKRVARKK